MPGPKSRSGLRAYPKQPDGLKDKEQQEDCIGPGYRLPLPLLIAAPPVIGRLQRLQTIAAKGFADPGDGALHCKAPAQSPQVSTTGSDPRPHWVP